jgi:hypothetical protein
MTPKEMAQELVYDMQMELPPRIGYEFSKEVALIAVTYIINANPHSNPLNTEVYSTMDYWLEVKKEIKKLNN